MMADLLGFSDMGISLPFSTRRREEEVFGLFVRDGIFYIFL